MANSTRRCRYCKDPKKLSEVEIVNGAAFCIDGEHKKLYAQRAQKKKANPKKLTPPKKRPGKTLRAQCLQALQLLRRLEEADDIGYCRCVSCDKAEHYKGMDGGHFIAKGHSSFWALEEENVHPQCKDCNGFGMKYGVAAYRYQKYMERRYGKTFVDNMLETTKDKRKISAHQYREMLEDFKARIAKEKKRIAGCGD